MNVTKMVGGLKMGWWVKVFVLRKRHRSEEENALKNETVDMENDEGCCWKKTETG